MSSLYIDRKGIELELDAGALVFRERGERIGTVPLAPVSRIFMRGDVRLQSSLLAKLGEMNIGVIVLSGRKAEPTLLMARPHNDASRRLAQFQRASDPTFCWRFSQQLIHHKLTAQREFLAQRRDQELEHRYELTLALRKLDGMLAELNNKTDIASLRGLEGAAAAGYFQGLAAIAPPSLQFKTRNRRPPKDPLNAMLSLGYTLLHAETVLALYGSGLDPFIGFYHTLDFGRESLACDVMEPLRVDVDQAMLELFRSEVLRKADFSHTESGCLLGKAGRARFYQAWDASVEKIRRQLAEAMSQLLPQIGGSSPALSGEV